MADTHAGGLVCASVEGNETQGPGLLRAGDVANEHTPASILGSVQPPKHIHVTNLKQPTQSARGKPCLQVGWDWDLVEGAVLERQPRKHEVREVEVLGAKVGRTVDHGHPSGGVARRAVLWLNA